LPAPIKRPDALVAGAQPQVRRRNDEEMEMKWGGNMPPQMLGLDVGRYRLRLNDGTSSGAPMPRRRWFGRIKVVNALRAHVDLLKALVASACMFGDVPAADRGERP
jgi:hypothetical protein